MRGFASFIYRAIFMSTVPQSKIYRGWFKEFFWFLLFLLHLPVGLFHKSHFRAGRRAPPIIILADLMCNPLFYRRLSARLNAEGYSVLTLSSGSIFRDLRGHASRLAEILEEKKVQEGILLGHGMGSLVALSLPDAGRQRIGHLVSLGTPFHGTRLLMALSFIPALRDMAVGSEYLLLNRMNALLFPMFDPFSAWQDEWIVPFNLAHFGQGRDLIFDEVGHYNLALGKDNLETLTEFLNERYPDPRTALEQAHLQLDAPRFAPPPESVARPAAVPASAKKKAATKKKAGKSSKKKTGKKKKTRRR